MVIPGSFGNLLIGMSEEDCTDKQWIVNGRAKPPVMEPGTLLPDVCHTTLTTTVVRTLSLNAGYGSDGTHRRLRR